MAEPVLPVLLEDGPEKQESQYAPDDEQEIGLCSHRPLGHEIGHQYIHTKTHHHHKTQKSGGSLDPVFPQLRQFHRGGGNHPIEDDCADGGHVYDPPDRGPACEGDQKAHPRHQKNGVGWDVVFIELSNGSRQDLVFCQRIQQPAEGRHIADEAGDDQRQ